MLTKHLAPILLAFALAGCSSATTDGGNASSDCSGGKCDAFLPQTLVSLDTVVGQCNVIPDDTVTDEFFMRDQAECAFVNLDEATGAFIHAVSVETVAQGTNRHSSARFEKDQLNGTSKPVANWTVDGYSIRMTTRPVVFIETTDGRLTEPSKSGRFVQPEIVTELAERPDAPQSTTMELPLRFDQVVVWPTQAFADKWSTGEVSFAQVAIESEVELGGVKNAFKSSRFAVAGDDLSLLTKTVFSLPMTAAGTASIEVRVDSNDVSGSAQPTGPGYYLLEADGQLTAATPADVEARGMFDRDAEAPQPTPGDDTDVEEPSTDPVDPPVDVDPCNGTCDATEACVSAACVPIADQRQFSCSSNPTAQCESDNDCAEGNACAGGLCRLRECQAQSTGCFEPFAVCEQDSDCAADHACAGGMCRRLSCQAQSTGCFEAFAVCEQSTDCDTDHACVEGVCRRLSCQTQSTGCFQPSAPCAQATDCADDHACVEGLCRLLDCQAQPSSCQQAFAPCAADGDCAEGHVCGESNTCERLTCIQ